MNTRAECAMGHKWYPHIAGLILCPVCQRPPTQGLKAEDGYRCPDHKEKAVLVTDGYTKSGYYYPCCGRKVRYGTDRVKEEVKDAG